MLHERLSRARGLVHQVSGDTAAPTLVYLPGVHGDWTSFGRARPLLNRSRRVVEVAYPRRPEWTLDDFARGLEDLFDEIGVETADIVGESFGSLVGWKFGLAHPERVRSFTLVGGFSRAPRLSKARAAKWGLMAIPTSALELGIDLYARYRQRGGRDPSGAASNVLSFPASRTRLGRLAAANRMHLIQNTDFRPELHRVRFAVNYIGGAWDPIVPVRREIRTLGRLLPGENKPRSHLIPGATHVILSTHARQTTDRILEWTDENGRGE